MYTQDMLEQMLERAIDDKEIAVKMMNYELAHHYREAERIIKARIKGLFVDNILNKIT